MEKFNCLVCNCEMVINHKISYVDHFCNVDDDHYFCIRIVNLYKVTSTYGEAEKTGEMMAKLYVKFRVGRERLNLKVHYDEKYSEAWSKSKTTVRLKINQIIIPDFTDIEKLKNKIRTILVFG
jgi:hypothetical protein